METSRFYNSPEWRDLSERARARDGHRCTVARLLGGPCSEILHAHHVVALADGGAPLDLDNVLTVCASHHPTLEALRRTIVLRRHPELRPCRHDHRYREGREECRRRRLARLGIAA